MYIYIYIYISNNNILNIEYIQIKTISSSGLFLNLSVTLTFSP